MQTTIIGKCPKCKVVTFRTSGYCSSRTCDFGDCKPELQVVKCCQWKYRQHRDECYECEVCGQVVAPGMPLDVSPLRACLAAADEVESSDGKIDT